MLINNLQPHSVEVAELGLEPCPLTIALCSSHPTIPLLEKGTSQGITANGVRAQADELSVCQAQTAPPRPRREPGHPVTPLLSLSTPGAEVTRSPSQDLSL